jgi:hypothetical protein
MGMRHFWNNNWIFLIVNQDILEDSGGGRSFTMWENLVRHQVVGRELCMLETLCGVPVSS